MAQIELSAGLLEYEDTGGNGDPLVMVHGIAMDGRIWRGVTAELPRRRCILPTMPLGAHRHPMNPDADLSLRGMGRLLAEFIERLALERVTLCFNDWSGAQTMVADDLVDRVERMVLVSCETDGNYPPGLGGNAAWISAKLPGGLSMMRLVLSRPRLRSLPFVFGQMSKRGIPDDLMSEWLEPLKRAEIRRDLRKYLGDARPRGARDIRSATPALTSFDGPVLVVWDEEGKMMPNEEGRRLANAFPDAQLVEVDDCFTLIPHDRPHQLASLLRDFLERTSAESESVTPAKRASR